MESLKSIIAQYLVLKALPFNTHAHTHTQTHGHAHTHTHTHAHTHTHTSTLDFHSSHLHLTPSLSHSHAHSHSNTHTGTDQHERSLPRFLLTLSLSHPCFNTCSVLLLGDTKPHKYAGQCRNEESGPCVHVCIAVVHFDI